MIVILLADHTFKVAFQTTCTKVTIAINAIFCLSLQLEKRTKLNAFFNLVVNLNRFLLQQRPVS